MPLKATEGSVVDQAITDSIAPTELVECKGQEMQWCDKNPTPHHCRAQGLKSPFLRRKGRGGEEERQGEWGAGAGDVPIYGQKHSV